MGTRHVLPVAISLLAILLVASVIIGLVVGAAGITARQTVSILLAGPKATSFADFSSAQHRIIWQLRLPRVLSAAVAGLVLTVAGIDRKSTRLNSSH